MTAPTLAARVAAFLAATPDGLDLDVLAATRERAKYSDREAERDLVKSYGLVLSDLRQLATLRDAPGIIREQQAEIERRGKLVEEACGLLDREAGFAQHPFRARLTAEIERLREALRDTP